MATNEMYRQLLSQVVNKQGSALIGGGYHGSALIGGYYPHVKKEKREKVSEEEEKRRMANGLKYTKANGTIGFITPQAYTNLVNRMNNKETKEKMAAARAADEKYIDSKLKEKYGTRTQIPKLERAITIAYARDDLRKQKYEEYKKSLTPEKIAEMKMKRQEYELNAAARANFPRTKEGVAAYRKSKITQEQREYKKRLNRLVNQEVKKLGLRSAAKATMTATRALPVAGPFPLPVAGMEEGKKK